MKIISLFYFITIVLINSCSKLTDTLPSSLISESDKISLTTECNNGTITLYPNLSYYKYGDTVTLVTKPNNTNYYFLGWNIDSSRNDTLKIIVKHDSLIVSTYIPIMSMKRIYSTGNSFLMGSDSGQADESPVHSVSFTYDFYIDSVEVTQEKFNYLMKKYYTNYKSPAWDTLSGKYGYGLNYPAFYINWYDAVLYCNAKSKEMGIDTVYEYSSITGTVGRGPILNNLYIHSDKIGIRLPFEAEWEFAARAGTSTIYYWGDDDIDYYAWCGSNSEKKVHPVASKYPNNFGLYDMSGNVWEWCNDWYGKYPSNDVSDYTGQQTGSFKALRGGSRFSDSLYVSSSIRSYDYPYEVHLTNGFRTVLPIIER